MRLVSVQFKNKENVHLNKFLRNWKKNLEHIFGFLAEVQIRGSLRKKIQSRINLIFLN